jgi:hypothetical protein
MHAWLVDICHWLQNIPPVLWLSGSDYAYPFIQLTHFTGLSLWLGTTLTVDFRLLGLGKNFRTASQLSDALFALNWTGLGIAVLGGFTLFSTAAVGYIDNPAFRLKLAILIPLALMWHIFVQRKTRTWGHAPETPPVAKLAGLIEILLWVSVATAAVWIPNYT